MRFHSLTELSWWVSDSAPVAPRRRSAGPEVSDSLTAESYLRIRELLGSYCSVGLTDCGAGVTHNATKGILQSAENLIIVTG